MASMLMGSTLKVFFLLYFSTGCSLKSCPPPVLWTPVATETCQDVTYYHCLLNDSANEFVNTCLKPVKYPAGSSIVLDGNLNAESCRDDRYQPWPYWSNEFYTCAYKKSLCNEEGQIIASKGQKTSTADRTCRCDYRKGYAFITPPKNRCFCVPSKEDCGCYLKSCPNSSYSLSPDYECEMDPTFTPTCPLIVSPSVPPRDRDTESHRMLEYDNTKYNIQIEGEVDKPVAAVLMTIIICILLICATVVYDVFGGKDFQDEVYVLRPSTIKRLTRREIKNLKKDNTFISTSGYQKALSALKDKDAILLKGRYGTGKTMMALTLASYYVDRGYEAYKFEKANIDTFNLLMESTKHRVIILENIIGDMLQQTTDFNEWKTIISFLFGCRTKTKLIITTYLKTTELWEIFIQNINGCQDMYVDLDDKDGLTVDEKTSILQIHCRKHERNIDQNDVNVIVTCNPVIGFPLMCSLFCLHDNYFSMRTLYFTQTPTALVEKVAQLKDNGLDYNFEGIKFSVLVYIAISKEECVSLHESRIDLKTFKTIFQSVYNKPYTHGFTSFENAANTFRGQYLTRNEDDKFTFRNPAIKRAVLITYAKNDSKCVIENTSIDDLLNIVRPAKYRKVRNESVLQLKSQDEYHAFPQRIGRECFDSELIAITIAKYVTEYMVRCNDIFLLEGFLVVLKEVSESTKKDNWVASLVTVFQEITNNYCLPKHIKPISFRLSWELVCAAKSLKDDRFKQLIDICKDLNMQDDVLFCIMDEYNNTLLHYFVLWNYDESLILLNKNISLQALNTTNKLGFTPVFSAAYLARYKYLQHLLESHDTKKKSLIFQSKRTIALGKVFSSSSKEDEAQFKNLMGLLEDGESKREQVVLLPGSTMKLTYSSQVAPSIKFGTQEDFETSKQILLKFYSKKKPGKKSEQNVAEDNVEYCSDDEFVMVEHETTES